MTIEVSDKLLTYKEKKIFPEKTERNNKKILNKINKNKSNKMIFIMTSEGYKIYFNAKRETRQPQILH